MARPRKYEADQILDTAALLVGERGPSALSIAGVAERLGAPTGSIYHRFGSRDILAASLWLRAVESFQAGFGVALVHRDPRTAARLGAAHVLTWSRENLEAATLLLLYRSSDFVSGGWPSELEKRNAQQRASVSEAMEGLCVRLAVSTKPDRRRVTFAVVDIPYGAVRSSLGAGVTPPIELDTIVDDAVCAVIDGIGRRV